IIKNKNNLIKDTSINLSNKANMNSISNEDKSLEITEATFTKVISTKITSNINKCKD
ncbi:344_t:CDS:1, partial [Scutellospora calospora]